MRQIARLRLLNKKFYKFINDQACTSFKELYKACIQREQPNISKDRVQQYFLEIEDLLHAMVIRNDAKFDKMVVSKSYIFDENSAPLLWAASVGREGYLK